MSSIFSSRKQQMACSLKSLVVAIALGMAIAPNDMTTPAFAAAIDIVSQCTPSLQLDFTFTTGRRYEYMNCAFSGSDLAISKAVSNVDTAVNQQIVITNPSFTSTAKLTVSSGVNLGKGSSITVTGGTFATINNALQFSVLLSHPSAFVTIHNINAQLAPLTFGSTINAGTVTVSKSRLESISVPNFMDAELNLKSNTVGGSLTFSSSASVRSKITVDGIGSSCNTIPSFPGLDESQFTFADTTVFDSFDEFFAIGRLSKVLFINNEFAGNAKLSTYTTNGDADGTVSFNKNTFKGDDNKLSAEGGSFEFSSNNVFRFTSSTVRQMEAILIATKNSIVAIDGQGQTFTTIAITDKGANSQVILREIAATTHVALTMQSSVNADILVTKVATPLLRITGSSQSPAVSAKLRVLDNHQIGAFLTPTDDVSFDNSEIIFKGNKFYDVVSTSAPSSTFASRFMTPSCDRSSFIFEDNTIYNVDLQIESGASNVLRVAGNNFLLPVKTQDALRVAISGGKFYHDLTNTYLSGNVLVLTEKTDGNVFALDATNSFATVYYRLLDGVNADLQFRGLTADSLLIDLTQSSHSSVIVESITANSLKLSGDAAAEVASSFMTLVVLNNHRLDYFEAEDLSLKDSNVTFFGNRFVAKSTWGETTFTRSRALFKLNTFSNLEASFVKAEQSEVAFKGNRFTQVLVGTDALNLAVIGAGRFAVDASNTFAGGDIHVVGVKNQMSVFELEGSQAHGVVDFDLSNGVGERVSVKGPSAAYHAKLTGSVEPTLIVDAVSGSIAIDGDSDATVSKAMITIQKNRAVTAIDFVDFNLRDSTIEIAENAFRAGGADRIDFATTTLQDTTVLVRDNRLTYFSATVDAAKNSVLRFRNNQFLAVANDNALLLTLVDGGSVDHDATNKYYGGIVSVESTRGVDNIFILTSGMQYHESVSFVEKDGSGAFVDLSTFTARTVTIGFEGSRNAKAKLAAASVVEGLYLNGGVGLTTTGSQFVVADSIIGSVTATNMNLANSDVLFENNNVIADSFTWFPATITQTTVAFTANALQYALDMSTAAIAEGSALVLRNNTFWESDAAQLAFAANIVANGRIDHDKSNVYSGGSIAVTSVNGRDNAFVLEGSLAFGPIAFTETGAGVNAYVGIRGLTTSAIAIDLGNACSASAALVESVTVTGAVKTSMTHAVGSYIGIEKSTLSGGVTLSGSLLGNSHYWVREVTSTAGVVVATKTHCSESEPCRVEVEGSKLSSKAAGSPLEITGSVGDFTTFSAASNRLGSSATGLGIALTSPTALTGSASLVIARNTASRYAALKKALYFAQALTFTGSADVWGNAFISGAIRLKLGASTSTFNMVNNRADFYLISGPPSSGRVSVCNTLSGNDQSAHVFGAGFKTEECSAATTVSVCGGKVSRSVKDETFDCSAVTAPVVAIRPEPGTVVAPVTEQPPKSLFLQSAGTTSVWASVATAAVVGALMAL